MTEGDVRFQINIPNTAHLAPEVKDALEKACATELAVFSYMWLEAVKHDGLRAVEAKLEPSVDSAGAQDIGSFNSLGQNH